MVKVKGVNGMAVRSESARHAPVCRLSATRRRSGRRARQEDLHARQPGDRGARRRHAAGAGGRVPGADGPVGLRQDDAAQPDRRPRPADVGTGWSWPEPTSAQLSRRRAGQVAQPQRRLHLPVLQPDPGADRVRERRAAAAAHAAVEAAAARTRDDRAQGRRARRSRRSTIRASSRAARSSASPSPAPSSPIPACSSPTSRPAISMRRAPRRSWR